MRMRKPIKRYVTVLELTNPHHRVQLFWTIFATVDLYYPTRPFDAIFVSNDWMNCEDFAKLNNNNNNLPHACIRPNNQSTKILMALLIITKYGST